MKIYLNGVEVSELNELRKNDKLKLVVIDANDNENIYEIEITSEPIIISILAGIMTLAIIVVPIVFVVNTKKRIER